MQIFMLLLLRRRQFSKPIEFEGGGSGFGVLLLQSAEIQLRYHGWGIYHLLYPEQDLLKSLQEGVYVQNTLAAGSIPNLQFDAKHQLSAGQ